MRKPFCPLPFLSLLALCAACSPDAPDPGSAGRAAPRDTARGSVQAGRIYDRAVVFLTPRADSMLVVPWMFTARARPGAVQHEARAWLARGGAWEPFFAETWESPPSRVPWRLLPRGSMRLVVGQDDALERILFDAGPRNLETVLGPTRVEWSGRRGESYRVLDGAALLSSQRVQGMVLDVSRVRRPEDPPPGDWGLLTSGDTLQVLIAAPEAAPPGTTGAYQAWARLGFREIQWPRVTVSWAETRAFERARRDIPVAWRVRSPNGQLQGSFEVRSAHIEAGEGEGPLLPVEAFFEVAGTVRLGGVEYPVRGFLRHSQ